MTMMSEKVLLPPPIKPEWMSVPLDQMGFEPGMSGLVLNTINYHGLWTMVSAQEAESESKAEIAQHIVDEAVRDARIKVKQDREELFRMQDNYRAEWIGRMVAEQCMGINPILKEL